MPLLNHRPGTRRSLVKLSSMMGARIRRSGVSPAVGVDVVDLDVRFESVRGSIISESGSTASMVMGLALTPPVVMSFLASGWC